MSGGKGGSSSSTVEIPQWLEDPVKRTLARAESIADIPYVPYSGPEVAQFSPMQEAAFANTRNAASAFGMDPGQGAYMPDPMGRAGARGYGSIDGYNMALDYLKRANPEAFAAISGGYMAAGDPYNTLGGMRPMAPVAQPDDGRVAFAPSGGAMGSNEQIQDAMTNGGFSGVRQDLSSDNYTAGGRGMMGGYTGIGDMFDGGGPGASGDTYKGGGLLSGAANRISARNERRR